MSLLENFSEVKKWEDIEPSFKELQKSNPQTLLGLKRLIHRYSDLLSVFYESETRADKAFDMNMENKKAIARHETFVTNIRPVFEKAIHEVDDKIVSHPHFRGLQEGRYQGIYRIFKQSKDEYREAHISLEQEIEMLSSRCEQIIGNLTMEIGGVQSPLSLGNKHLESNDRGEREDVWRKIQEARLEVKEELDALFSAMVPLRHSTGRRAGHMNFRQYQHCGAYPQYTIKQADLFHRAIEHHVVPLAHEITQKHRKRLGLKGKWLRPWDTDASQWGMHGTPPHLEPLKPFRHSGDLVQKSIDMLSEVNPLFGKCLSAMDEEGMLDLGTRKAKARSSFCNSLEATGMPFISMQASGRSRDLPEFLHETGHAMHVWLTRNEPLVWYRYHGTDNVIAETASLSMELLSMKHWNKCYEDEGDHKRAMRRQLEEIVRFLPWCALMDKFQHWIYENPHHAPAERDDCFVDLMDRFYPSSINWRGLERYRRNYWQKITHVFSTPFYYIEYGFALLAALQIYQNYLKDPGGAVNAYIRGLRMGASQPYPKVWKEMGVTLSFSSRGFQGSLNKIPGLMGFVMEELEKTERAL